MEWLIAGAVSWIFGSFGYFVFVVVMGLAFPRLTQALFYLILGPMTWGGATIIVGFLGAIFGLLPGDPSAFKIAAVLTAIPSWMWIHSMAQSLNPLK